MATILTLVRLCAMHYEPPSSRANDPFSPPEFGRLTATPFFGSRVHMRAWRSMHYSIFPPLPNAAFQGFMRKRFMAHVMRGSHMASSSTFSQVLLSRMINPIRAVQGRHWRGGPMPRSPPLTSSGTWLEKDIAPARGSRHRCGALSVAIGRLSDQPPFPSPDQELCSWRLEVWNRIES